MSLPWFIRLVIGGLILACLMAGLSLAMLSIAI
jgi:hypothetical protein